MLLPKISCFALVGSLLLAGPVVAQRTLPRTKPATSAKAPAKISAKPTQPTPIANPVLAGDFPDPSVTKVGDTYWATATSSNWGPTFPLLKSTDLQHWALVGHVFPGERPAWADYYFWAPEISHEANGKTYVFYTAHQRGGNLAVGVASADRPEGPYRDHGPLVGQPDGSIDGFPVTDEHGQPYLIWKEDGNSVQKPTPLWAQRLSADRTKLVGEKKELFRNTEAWEGNLVEGPSVVRHGGYFYLFYAANGCCGAGCTYATGVARAKSLLGPWEKYSRNPILTKSAAWTCPGHGTAIERNGHWYMLHHAYQVGSVQYVGRQGILSEFTWTQSGWPEFIANPSAAPAPAPAVVADEFTAPHLAPAWEWPVEDRPQFALRGGQLHLTAQPDRGGAALGLSTLAADYSATTTLLNPGGLPAGTTAGIAALGDPNNFLSLKVSSSKLHLVERRNGRDSLLLEVPLPANSTQKIHLRLQSRAGSEYQFAFSPDGSAWTRLTPLLSGPAYIDGQFLPPWDRGVRVGIVAQGPASATATFERFELVNK